MTIDKFIFDAKQKLSRNESIMKAIDFGIEREMPKLEDDEIIEVKIENGKQHAIVDVLRVKKEKTNE